jgi:hypothetical protein
MILLAATGRGLDGASGACGADVGAHAGLVGVLYLVRGADFIGLVQFAVYVGAVAV